MNNASQTCQDESAEAVVWKCSVKKVLLEISQNSQENTCTRVNFLLSCRLLF